MQRDYPLDPADTLPIRRFVKLRPVPKAGVGVYRTYACSPLDLLLENGFEKIGKSRRKPDRRYLRAPDPTSTSPFPVIVRIPKDETILALASELIAKGCKGEGWQGRLGSWRGRFDPDGPRDLCGTMLNAMDEDELRLVRAPGLLLYMIQVGSVAVRWPNGFDEPVWDRRCYVSHLEHIETYF